MSQSSIFDQLSFRSYLLRAVFTWCCEHDAIPYLVVADSVACQLPKNLVVAGRVTFNIGPTAAPDCRIEYNRIEFSARFQGEVEHIIVPIGRINALYARDSGLGVTFSPTDEELVLEEEALDTSIKNKPFLRIVK